MSNNQARFVFRYVGSNIWEFAFGSEHGHIGKDVKGFEYLARLLAQPNSRISPLELSLAKAPESIRRQAGQDRPDELLDAEGVRNFKRRKLWLEEQLAVSENALLENELREIVLKLKRATRPGGNRIKSRSSDLKKACQRVQNAVNRALQAMRDAGLIALVEHLKDCPRPDNWLFVYRATNPPNWDVNWLR